MQNRGGMGPGETRNVIIAIVLSLAILLGFEFFYNAPQRERLVEQQRAQAEAQLQQQPTSEPAKREKRRRQRRLDLRRANRRLGPPPRASRSTRRQVDGSISLRRRADRRSQPAPVPRARSRRAALKSPSFADQHRVRARRLLRLGAAERARLSTLSDAFAAMDGDRRRAADAGNAGRLTLDGRERPQSSNARSRSTSNYMFTITDRVRNNSAAAVRCVRWARAP